jgi:SAM-dependent methyltransferase
MTSSIHIKKNSTFWNQISAEYQRVHGAQLGIVELTWGVWSIPESQLHVLGDVAGKDVLEFGCGGAQGSLALARRGAHVTGIDLSKEQLRHARELVEREGLAVTLVHGSAEQTPFADQSFDVVFADHGAMAFADPRLTVPEAARLLRPGGLFAFNIATPFLRVAYDPVERAVGYRLVGEYFSVEPTEEDGAVLFRLSYGEWIGLFRRAALLVEDLVEIRPPEGATTTYKDYAPIEWARRYPAEHIWKLRRPPTQTPAPNRGMPGRSQ